MFIDTHCHLYLGDLADKKNEVISSFKEKGGDKIINIGVDIESSKEVIKIAENFKNCKATIGIHPCYVMDQKNKLEENIGILKNLYQNNKDKIVGIGEAGLDNFHLGEDIETEKNLQKKYFEAQINLSKELGIPIIIHTRNAGDETIETLKNFQCTNFIIHCFSEDINFAKKCMEFSNECVFAFGGILTFPKSNQVKEAAKFIPLNRIVIETDAPYLAPQSHRGQLNKPEYVLNIIEYLSEIRGEDFEKVQKKVYENSVNFFKI